METDVNMHMVANSLDIQTECFVLRLSVIPKFYQQIRSIRPSNADNFSGKGVVLTEKLVTISIRNLKIKLPTNQRCRKRKENSLMKALGKSF